MSGQNSGGPGARPSSVASGLGLLLNEPFPYTAARIARSGEKLGPDLSSFATHPPSTFHQPPAFHLNVTAAYRPTLAFSDSLWSVQRQPLHDGLGQLPLRPSSCICSTFSAHLQQPPSSAGCRLLKPTSSARCFLPRPTRPQNPTTLSCRIGASLWFFLSKRKSRGDLAHKPVSASHPSSPPNAPAPPRQYTLHL